MAQIFSGTFQNKQEISSTQHAEWIISSFSKGNIFVELKEDCNDFNLHMKVEDSANVQVLILNHATRDCTLDVTVDMEEFANCKMGVLDLQDAGLNWNQKTNMNKEGSHFEIWSAQLCLGKQMKKGNMEVEHFASHTEGLMHNFAVLFDEGKYEMVANGNIRKGCIEAQSHQATRVLTLGKKHSAKVVPLLLIDENNVKASHALTIGQPDENQLYYLQSRGLSVKQALGLLSVGYFLPVIDFVEDEELKLSIREEMERKVGLYGQQ
ncbi:MAG: SufD family Fe-S cluster assembly protein [Holdemanella sp.]|nr:SufD family Fe-S cluster assembly protein [Holdemanella sp.]